MTKEKITYYCTNCDYRPPKWIGCCPGCKEWETISELQKKTVQSVDSVKLQSLQEIPILDQTRMISGINEWDRVLGGGLMPGSLLLLTGDPGIGKSTLLLQIAHQLAQNYSVIYFSSEESLQQIKQRANRLACTQHSLLFSDQSSLESIMTVAKQQLPHIIILDSIQNCYLSSMYTPGSIAHLREIAFELMRIAREYSITLIVTGHITKEGVVAGPKLLEHMVDGVFYLQGDDHWQTRILRSMKNRFGTINELGFFQMNENGLQPVPDINQELLNQASFSPGSAIVSSIEGSRPLLLEVQALTSATKFGIPQRVISGIDHKQVIIIAAILEKYLKIPLSSHDIFFKVSNGFKIKESSADLGIALALLSSYFQKPLPEKMLALAEVGLTGHIKPVNQVALQINEAKRFGIQTALVSHNQRFEKITNLRHLKSVYELLMFFQD